MERAPVSQLKQDLDNTYLELELHGWCQAAESADGRVCLEEAVALAVGRDASYWSSRRDDRQNAALYALYDKAYKVSSATLSGLHMQVNLWQWNDQSGRTVEDVKALVKAAWEDAA